MIACSSCGQPCDPPKGRRCRDCINAAARKYYAAGGERKRETKRRYMAKMRQDPAFRERANAASRGKYTEQNRKRRQALKADFFAHRARIHRYRWKVQVTAADLRQLWNSQEGRCALTGRALDESAQLDHIIPISRGGSHELPNLQWLTAEVNLAKRDLTSEEFIALASECVEWIARRLAAADTALSDTRGAA